MLGGPRGCSPAEEVGLRGRSWEVVAATWCLPSCPCSVFCTAVMWTAPTTHSHCHKWSCCPCLPTRMDWTSSCTCQVVWALWCRSNPYTMFLSSAIYKAQSDCACNPTLSEPQSLAFTNMFVQRTKQQWEEKHKKNLLHRNETKSNSFIFYIKTSRSVTGLCTF